MKRLSIPGLRVAVALAITGTACALLLWIVATASGARWFFTAATSVSGIGFSAQTVEGRIIDHLLLTKVRITLAQQKVELDTLELRWKPFLLLTGTIAIQELFINGVQIQDDTPPPSGDTAPLLVWPGSSGSAQLFDGTIGQLRITHLTYRHRQEQPVPVTNIATSATWQDGLLSFSNLTAVSPSGRIQGAVSADFSHAGLTADLAVALAHPAAEMDQFSLLIQRCSAASGEQLAGTFTVTGATGKKKMLEMHGDAGMTHNTFNLRRLALTRPGKRGLITGGGSLAFTPRESLLSLQIKLASLDLAPELNVPTNLSGTLNFAGTPDNYRGTFTLDNQARGWQAATVSASYTGNREEVKLSLLTSRVLDGTLKGNLYVDWRNGWKVRGAVSGRKLNPARIDPGWRGVANFNATGTIARTGDAPVTATISGDLLESRLHGQALTGLLHATFAGNNISISRLELRGKGFDLHASGKLDRRLSMAARITDLSRAVPGSAGTLRGDGWVRWRNRHLSGEFSGTGDNLAYAGTEIKALALNATLDEGAGYPLHAAVSLRDLVHNGSTLDAVTVGVDGSVLRHIVNAHLHADTTDVQLSLSAGYRGALWKGEITQLGGTDGTTLWSLAAPASFALSTRKCVLSPLSLTTGAAERIEVSADLALNPPGGTVQAEWNGIDLAVLKPWFPQGIKAEGHISGRAHGTMLPGKRFFMDGTTALSGVAIHQERPGGTLNIAITEAAASWRWQEKTFAGNLSLTMAEYGQATANFRLPVPAHFPLTVNKKGTLQATVSGQLRENGLMSSLFPELIRESSGELDADLAVHGTWEAPQTGGKLQLTKGGAYLPAAGIRLQDIRLTAHLDKNLVWIDSFRAVSGPGHIEGTALITLAGWRVTGYQGNIRGTDFQTVHFPELQIQSSPELNFSGTPQKLTLRGDLRLPEMHIIGAAARTVIAPSSDVILELAGDPVVKSYPLELDIQLQVQLGDRVFVKIAGIDAQLGGGMYLTLSSFDTIYGTGEITVRKGRYRAYGVNLDIIRGRLFLAGGRIDHPTLDFLALRTIGDVRVGVTVAGTLQKPVTKLYSEPVMPDVDVLAYIVIGHPLGNSGEQASLVSQAASALLSSRQAGDLEDQIKNKLGLSILEIQGGVGETTGAMGYKPLQVTAPGAIPAMQQPGITETMFTVGKYVTPQLYISYGKSLFTGSNLFLLRYDLFKKWQIETQTGNESGVDLFYRLEFE